MFLLHGGYVWTVLRYFAKQIGLRLNDTTSMEHEWITQVYKVIAQKCNSFAKLQRSNLVWAMFETVTLSKPTV